MLCFRVEGNVHKLWKTFFFLAVYDVCIFISNNCVLLGLKKLIQAGATHTPLYFYYYILFSSLQSVFFIISVWKLVFALE